MQVQWPTRWKDLIIAKCLDTEAFFEGILCNKCRGFLFYLFVCLFALQTTHWSHPKGDAAFISLLHKKVKAGRSVFMIVCLCISSFLESVFFCCSLLLNETTSLWKSRGWKVPAVPDQKTKDVPSPHSPHSTFSSRSDASRRLVTRYESQLMKYLSADI